jgi:hypothetical protein
VRPWPQRASAHGTVPDFSLNFIKNGCRTAWRSGLKTRVARAPGDEGPETGFFQLFDALLKHVDVGREATPFAGIQDHADHVAVAAQSNPVVLLQDAPKCVFFSELAYSNLRTQRDRVFAGHTLTIPPFRVT